jgi:ABC-2 type transport system ATP-binding protein
VPTLDIDRLDKSYGELRALRGMTFSVAGGEIFGFVGSNGAGKSTTMRIVLGVLAADAGAVRWDGRELDHATRRRIGYMPEERGLYPRMTVADQLVYLARLHGLSPAAAHRSMEHWTEVLGIAARRTDEVLRLSLGNQQRAQLAAALVHEPEILVLDEPFSGLDPVAVDVMSGVLRDQAAAGVPVLFSSHQLELVERLCDRVGIVQAGSMVAVGSIDELRTTDERRWLVDGPAGASWAAAVPEVRVVSSQGTRTVVEATVGPGRDDPGGPGGVGGPGGGAGGAGEPASRDLDQRVLAAALAAGPVREFGRVHPSLVELYRDVVTAPAREEVPA